MQGIELRAYDIEVRVDGEGDKTPKIVGHAAAFDKLSNDLYGFREKIARGCFAKTIGKDDIRALWNHDPSYVLGRNKSGTLRLAEDDKGLAIEIDPPDTQWARDLMVSIKRGDVNQMSFAFRTISDKWEDMDKKTAIRTLLEVDLRDVSVVTYPAYPQTDVKVRSAQEVFESYVAQRDQEGAPPAAGIDPNSAQVQAQLEAVRVELELLENEI